MALQTILIAADGSQKTLNLDTEARLALGPDEKLIIPAGLKRKKALDDDNAATDDPQSQEEVLLVDESGEVYTVFLPEGAEVLVAQAQNPAQNPAPSYETFPTNPGGPGGSAQAPLSTIPVNPNASSGGGGFAPGDYGWAIAGGLGGVGLIAIAASDSGGGGGGGGGTPPPGGNAAPFFASEVRSVSVAENSTAVTTVVATDADDDDLTYSIIGGADASRFGIDSTTGTLTFLTAPDFEMPADNGGDNIYNVIVQASDGELNDTQELVITVSDVAEGLPNRAPIITSGDGDTAMATVNENTAFSTTVMASDPDADTVTFSLTGPDADLFTITSAGVLSLPAQDFENPADAGGNNSYIVTILASDGELTDSQVFTLTVADVNENGGPVDGNTVIGGVLSGAVTEVIATDPGMPIAQGEMTATDPDGPDNMFLAASGNSTYGSFQVTTAGVWTYSLNSADPAVSALNDGQMLPDSFTVTALDGSTSAVNITINGQTGAIDVTPDSIVGGDLLGAVVEAGSDGVGTPMDSGVLTAMNPDGPDNVFRPSNGNAAFGSFTVSTNGTWTYTLNNSDPTVNGLAEGEPLSDSFTVTSLDGSTGTVNVTITGANDDPTVDAAQVVTTVEDMPLTITVEAVDVDGDNLTYTAGPRAEGGQLTGGADGVYTYTPAADFIGRDSFVVTVSDGNGGTAEQTVSIDVTEANDDAPVIVSDGGGDEASIQIIENTVAVTDVDAEDNDTGAVITYSITGGAEETYFRIDEDTGVLEFWAPPSAEQGQGQGLFGNRYEVIVTATDDTGLTDSQRLLVDVQNDGLLNEIGELPPMITSGGGLDETQVELDENNTLITLLEGNGGQLINLDGTGDTLIFRIAGGDDAELFRIDQLASEPNTGLANLSFITAPDFEMPASANGDNEYDLIVQLSDDDGVDFQRITITVLDVDTVFVVDDVNDLLEAGGISNGRDVETASGNVLANDADEAGAPIRVASANADGGGPLIDVAPQGNTIQGEFGTLVINPDGSYVYTPDQALIDAEDIDAGTDGVQSINTGDTLTDTFIYTATNTDNVDGVRVPAELVITINGTNDAPVVDLNGPGPNGIDFMPNAFTEGGGAVTVVSANTLVFDVDNAQIVSATITLRGPGGALPNAQDERLMVNDTPAGVAPNTINSAYNPATGVLTLTGFDATAADFQAVLRTLTYNNLGDNVPTGATRTVTVVVNDGLDNSAVATSTLPLIGEPDAPEAMNDTNLATATQAADPLVEAGDDANGNPVAGDPSATGNVLANDVDPDTDDNIGLEVNLIRTVVGGVTTTGTVGGPALAGTYGNLLIEANGTWTYTLDNTRAATQALQQGQPVTEVYTYRAVDPDGLTDLATLTLTITGTNDAPRVDLNGANVNGTGFEATYVEPVDGAEAVPVNIVASNALLAQDPDNTQLASATVTLRGPNGELPDSDVERLMLSGAPAANITFTYNPDTGVATFVGSNATVAQFQAALRLLQYSSDGDSATPGPIRTATVIVNDGTSDSLAAVSTITLIGADNGPVANADSNLMAPANPVVEAGFNPGNAAFPGDPTATGNVLANDTDPDTAPADLSVTTIRTAPLDGTPAQTGFVGGVALVGTYGSLSISANGNWTYTLNNNDPDTQLLDQDQVEVDRFRYFVQDPEGNAASALLSISITGTNDAPVAVNNNRSVNEGGGPVTGGAPGTINNVLTNDTDPDGADPEGNAAELMVSQVNGATGNVGAPVLGDFGNLQLNANGSYTYTLLPELADSIQLDDQVQDVFTYIAIDEFGAESATAATLSFTITGAADPTTFLEDEVIVEFDENDTGVVRTVTAMDADQPMGGLQYTLGVNGDEDLFTLDMMTGELRFIAPPDFEDPQDEDGDNEYVVEVIATDPSDSDGASQTLLVQVQDVNEAPMLAMDLKDQEVGVTGAAPLNYTFDDDSFVDPDMDDMLAYTATLAGEAPLPAWLMFDGDMMNFSGTPTLADADNSPLTVVVTATDLEGETATGEFQIVINRPPVITNLMATSTGFSFVATDTDLDALGDTLNASYAGTLNMGDLDLPNPLTNGGTTTQPVTVSMAGSPQSSMYLVSDGTNSVSVGRLGVGTGGVDIIESNLVYGFAGNDILAADSTDSFLFGGAGNDDLRGANGNDLLEGGDDNDELRGQGGDDVLNGGGGTDFLDGGFGNDTLDGGAGNDTLAGGPGDDRLDVSVGNDIVGYAADALMDSVDGDTIIGFDAEGGGTIADQDIIDLRFLLNELDGGPAALAIVAGAMADEFEIRLDVNGDFGAPGSDGFEFLLATVQVVAGDFDFGDIRVV